MDSGLVEPRLVFLSTFPLDLGPDVERVLQLVEPLTGYSHLGDHPVLVDGSQLNVLQRFSGSEPSTTAISALSETQRLVLAALLSRHHDGRIRERYLDALFVDVSWTLHLILLVISEYVIEIAERAAANSDPIPVSRYQAFAANNATFMAMIRSRVVSYWDAYYKPCGVEPEGIVLGTYGTARPMKFIEYPAYRFLADRGLWTGREARHLIRRERRARS